MGERGLILAGSGAGHPDAVWELARAAGWPVLAEPTSGCRLPGAIAAADALLRTPLAQGWHPDVVLRLGAPWASRVVNEWVGALGCLQVLVDPWGTWSAPDRLPGEVVVAHEALCRAVVAALPAGRRGRWAAQWAQAETLAQGAIDGALAVEAVPTEPGTARRLLAGVPDGSTLVVSSSMPVRDVETWARPRSGVRVLANRGANGIDGVLSSALGVAAATPAGRTVALLGDLAFLYDANALLVGGAQRRWRSPGCGRRGQRRRGHLQFPAPGHEPARRALRKDVGRSPRGGPSGRGPGYGASVCLVSSEQELVDALASEDRGERTRVLVIKTDRAANVVVHRRLYEAVATAVSGPPVS